MGFGLPIELIKAILSICFISPENLSLFWADKCQNFCVNSSSSFTAELYLFFEVAHYEIHNISIHQLGEVVLLSNYCYYIITWDLAVNFQFCFLYDNQIFFCNNS